MKNNTDSTGSNEGWDSDEKIIGDMTAQEASRFLSSLVSNFAMMGLAYRQNGVRGVKAVLDLSVNSAIKLVDSGLVAIEDRDTAEEGIELGMAAAGLAAFLACSKEDPGSMFDLASAALTGVDAAAKQNGTDMFNTMAHVMVKKEVNGVQIGVAFISNDDAQKLLDAQPNIGAIKTMVDEMTSAPKPTPGVN